jgi:hypothetical protein
MKTTQTQYRINLEYDLSRRNERWNRRESLQLTNAFYYLEGIDGRLPCLRDVEQGWEIAYEEMAKTVPTAHLNILAQNKQQAAQIANESRITIENLLLPPYVKMPKEISPTEVTQ